MTTDHIMVDLETLGIGTDAAIIQVGACRFRDDGSGTVHGSQFKRNIFLTDKHIGTIDASTVSWWLSQDRETAKHVFDQEAAVPLYTALSDLFFWMLANKGDSLLVWSDAPTFDLRLIREAAARTGTKVPFSFREERCHRTIKWLGKFLRLKEPVRTGKLHDALDDAVNQANYASEVLAQIGMSRMVE